LLASAAVAVALGTVVTAAGPHGGDEDVERLALSGRDVARLHSIAVWVFVGVVVAIVARVWSDPPGRRRVLQLFGALVAQGVVGYIQYFNGVPVALVALHIAGATLTWTATIRLWVHLAETARAVNTRREATSFTTGLAHG
jgi:cytochrome c oxidase assembly protein subunit 15